MVKRVSDDDVADYQNLDAWKVAYHLTLGIYSTTRGFPAEERYGLTSQLRRSSASIGANLAEGVGRGADRDFARFVAIATGSANEVEVFLRLARDLDYLTPTEWIDLQESVVRVRSMLYRLRATLLAGSG